MNNILITGGSGFIGSNLIDRMLSLNKRIINIDNMNNYYNVHQKEINISSHYNYSTYQMFPIDILNKESLLEVFIKHRVDIIIHLAAMAGVRPSIEDPILYQNVNCLGTLNILEMAKKFGIKKIILASSSSVYGNNKKVPFSESDVVDYAISPYAATKKANEVMGHVYHKLYGIDMIFLRFFTVYGPRQRPDLAIHKFTKMILERTSIPFYGDGSSARDYTYIDDIVDGIIMAIEYLKCHDNIYEIINLGNSSPVSLSTMVKTIEDALGIKAIIDKQPMQPGDVDITYADISKAKSYLGYNPTTEFSEGINRFVKWYYDNLYRKDNI